MPHCQITSPKYPNREEAEDALYGIKFAPGHVFSYLLEENLRIVSVFEYAGKPEELRPLRKGLRPVHVDFRGPLSEQLIKGAGLRVYRDHQPD
jgi:hypothetical protein